MLYLIEGYTFYNSTTVIDKIQNELTTRLDHCLQNENDFNALRRDLPAFLISEEKVIEDLESDKICQRTYSSHIEKIQKCELAYDQVMKRGLTQTLYLLFSYAQSLHVRYKSEVFNNVSLMERIYDPKLRDYVDLLSLYLKDALDQLLLFAKDNSIGFFSQMSNRYLIVYLTYLCVAVIMCLILGLVVFKKLRQQILTSVNILAIMPLEEIQVKERVKIEKFLNS